MYDQQLFYELKFEYNEFKYQFFSTQLIDIQKWILDIQCVIKKLKQGLKNSQQLEKKWKSFLKVRYKNNLINNQRPLFRINIHVQLKNNSLNRTAKDNSQGNQYVLLIYIKSVNVKRISFQIFTNNDQE
ncbi:unnamed protein product [Paramecium sonneborni]|uniref:Uncharacterized protein n=1 Tax=Paramecium sonneborni TaxID=65129 RepID=A0A8S1NR67_9CILI|nr:unnamed protein product [Paramecium sonneborni]